MPHRADDFAKQRRHRHVVHPAERPQPKGECGQEAIDERQRKLVGMHLRQDSSELALGLLGPTAVLGEGESTAAMQRFLGTRALTIAGGTSEVLHNVIAERILGLPRG